MPERRWWSASSIKNRAQDKARIAGRDNNDFGVHNASHSEANNRIHIGAGSIFEAHEYAEKLAQPLHEEIAELRSALQAAEVDYVRLQKIGEQDDERRRKRLNYVIPLLILGGVFTLFIGMMLGRSISFAGSLFHAEAPATVTAQSTVAVTVTETATETATVSELPALDQDSLEVLPCEPGTWVAFLQSGVGALAESRLHDDLKSERARARSVEKKYDWNSLIHASRYPEVCPAARAYARPQDERLFIWVGPFYSRSDADEACIALRKPSSYDCLVEPSG